MRLLALLLLVGCSEYDLTHGDGIVDTPAGDEALDDDTPWWQDPFAEPPSHYDDPINEGTGDVPDAGTPPADDGGTGTLEPPADYDEPGTLHDPDGDDPFDIGVTVDPDGPGIGPDPGDFFVPGDEEEPPAPPDDDGETTGAARMTGGGVADGASHGFTVHCAFTHHSNHLQVNWDTGAFHLEGIDWVVCLDDPNVEPGQPQVGFDTVVGVGWGRLNGVDADVWFSFSDDGEPGTTDGFLVEIDPGMGFTFDFDGLLDSGNHQAHGAIFSP